MATTKYSKTKVSPTQRRAIVGGWDMYDPYAYERERLAAEAGQSTQRQALALQKRAHAIQREALANQNAASTVSGITGLLGTGAQLYMMKNLFQNPFLDPNQSQGMIDLTWETPAGNAQAQPLRAITSQAPMSAIPSSAIGSTPGVATAASPTNYTPMGSHISGGTFGTVTHNIPGLPQGITTQYPGIGGAGVPVGGSMGGGAAITPGASISTSAATTPGLPSLSSSLPGGSLAEAGSGMSTASTTTPGAMIGTPGPMIGVAMPYVAPAAAGYAAPGVLNMIHEGATENIGKALGISHSKTASTVGGGIAGAAAGAAVGAALTAWSGPGAVIGAIIGAIGGASGGGGGTWLCTAINKHVGMDEREKLDVIRLRKYALENHETMMLFYLNQGDGLVKAIEVEEGGLAEEFYARLKTNMLTPCLELVREKKLEEAYELYRDYTTELFNHYTPGLELPKETKVDTEGGE